MQAGTGLPVAQLLSLPGADAPIIWSMRLTSMRPAIQELGNARLDFFKMWQQGLRKADFDSEA
ncbi:MAG TPA: hypothetical protein VGG99_01055 [Acetobacteraceae bacterium]|jgi:hypothetical protein